MKSLSNVTLVVVVVAVLIAGCATNGVQVYVSEPSAASSSAQHAGQVQAVLVSGSPALTLNNSGWQYTFTLVNYDGDYAFQFPVTQIDLGVFQNDFDSCWGILTVTRRSVSFAPTIKDSQCNLNNGNDEWLTEGGAWNASPSSITYENTKHGNSFTDKKGNQCGFWPLYTIIQRDGTQVYSYGGSNDWTNGTFSKWINLTVTDFDTAISQFEVLTANLAVPLSAKQQAAINIKESAGDTATVQHDYREALSEYLAAMQALPVKYPPRDVNTRLRNKVITTTLLLNPRPAIPDDAVRYEQFGKVASESANLPNAIDNFQQAVRIAPWWADGYYNLAVAQEKAKMYGAAADALQWYLRAAPNAPDAANVKLKIYQLQYQQSQQQSGP